DDRSRVPAPAAGMIIIRFISPSLFLSETVAPTARSVQATLPSKHSQPRAVRSGGAISSTHEERRQANAGRQPYSFVELFPAIEKKIALASRKSPPDNRADARASAGSVSDSSDQIDLPSRPMRGLLWRPRACLKRNGHAALDRPDSTNGCRRS